MYKLSPGFVIEKLDNKIVLLDTKTLTISHFNNTASYILKMIMRKKNINEIAEFLIIKYGISQNRAHKDIEKLLTELQRKKIIISA